MKGSEMPGLSVPDECRDWVSETYRTLDLAARKHAQGVTAPGSPDTAARERVDDAAGALVDAVLSGNYARAHDLCHSALSHPDVGSRRVYSALMLPAIRAVGRAWADDTASFERTSLAFSLLHRLLDRLAQATQPGRSSQISARLQGSGQRILVTVAPGDSHSFGAMILTQELLLRGWSVALLDHRRSDDVIAALADEGYDTLAISVSCDESMAALADFVSTCRMANRGQHLDVVIGGAAIQPPFAQYQFLKADKVGLGIEEVGDYLLSQDRNRRPEKWN